MREGPLAALDAIEQATGENKVHAIGYCVGGTLLAITLAYMAAKGDNRIASATLFAAQVDFTHAGDLKVFVDEEQLEALEKRMAERGYLEGKKMANAFNMLRSNDLIWPYVINNYLRGKAPMPFDLLYWNSDATRMPAANHSFYLRKCYLNNTLSKGKMTIANVKLDLEQGQGAALQSRHARGPHRAGEIGVPRLEVLRRAGEVTCCPARATSPASSIRRARANTSTGPAATPAQARSRPGSRRPRSIRARGGRTGSSGSSRTATSRSPRARARRRQAQSHRGRAGELCEGAQLERRLSSSRASKSLAVPGRSAMTIESDTSRREFLGALGAGVAAAGLARCADRKRWRRARPR